MLEFENIEDAKAFEIKVKRHWNYWGNILTITVEDGKYYIPLNKWTEPLNDD